MFRKGYFLEIGQLVIAWGSRLQWGLAFNGYDDPTEMIKMF